MTTAERLVGIVPSLALFATLFSGFAVYAIVRRRIPTDREISERVPSVLLGSFVAQYYAWVLGPIERALIRLRTSPNVLTWVGLGMSALAGAAFAVGWFSTGGWLYLGNGTVDILDGRIARRTGRQSRTGALFDSVVDRYAEYFVFAGLLIYYRDRIPLMLTTLLALLGSFMVSYTRARGESLGVDTKFGTMQRPERILYLGASAAASPVVVALLSPSDTHPPHHLTVAVLVLLAVTANVTAFGRFRAIREALENAPPSA